MEKFTAEEIINFIRKINCMNDKSFFEMYKYALGSVSKYYVEEKFNYARSNISNWMCSLDYETLESFMKFCLKK
jgi:hypothetical protein